MLSTYCKNLDKYQRIANGDGTDREQLVEQNSTYCGYVPPSYPAAGTVIGYSCKGFDKYNKIADGNGGFTEVLAQRNAQVCGYSPPAVGTVLAEFCVGRDLWRRYADGNDGYTEALYQAKSTTCGYVAPSVAKPSWATPQDQIITNPSAGVGGALNDMVINNDDGTVSYGRLDWNVYNSAGALVYSGTNSNASFTTKNYTYIPQGVWANNSSYTIYGRFIPNGAPASPWSDALRLTVRYEEFAPYGTWLGEKCIGFDKYNVRANGTGGTYDELVERNSGYCGYVNPIDPGFSAIPGDFSATSSFTPAGFTLNLANGGNWSSYTTSGSTRRDQKSGRYLTGNAVGWEILFESNPYGDNWGEENPHANIPEGQWVSMNNGCIISLADSLPENDGMGYSGRFRFTLRNQAMGISRAREISYQIDGGCFVIGTKIMTPDGDCLVEDLEISDIVTSFSEPTMVDSGEAGWMGWKAADTSHINVDEMSLVTANRQFVAEKSIKLNGLHSTLSHVHFVYDPVKQSYGWKKAEDVVVGDAFVSRDKHLIPIISVEKINTPHVFVWLNVEDIDTLQVKLGDTYILTHNVS